MGEDVHRSKQRALRLPPFPQSNHYLFPALQGLVLSFSNRIAYIDSVLCFDSIWNIVAFAGNHSRVLFFDMTTLGFTGTCTQRYALERTATLQQIPVSRGRMWSFDLPIDEKKQRLAMRPRRVHPLLLGIELGELCSVLVAGSGVANVEWACAPLQAPSISSPVGLARVAGIAKVFRDSSSLRAA